MSLDPATISAGIGAAGTLFGGSGQAQAAVPSDLAGPRAQTLQLLQYLLGYGNPAGAPGGASGARGGGVSRGGTGGFGSTQGATSPNGFTNLPSMGDPTNRLESFFGGLGVQNSPLQDQTLQALQAFLSGPAPEASGMEALNKILAQNPGQGMLDALQPRFQQNLSAAQSQGPRFSSGNALTSARALDDYNLLAQQALAQGVNQQLQASQIQSLIGNNQFNRLAGGYGIGQQQANQQDIATQRRLQILMNLLGVQQSATLGLPITQGGDFLTHLGQAGSNFGNFLQRQSQGNSIPVAPPVPYGAMDPTWQIPPGGFR